MFLIAANLKALGFSLHRSTSSSIMSVLEQIMNSCSLKNSLDILFGYYISTQSKDTSKTKHWLSSTKITSVLINFKKEAWRGSDFILSFIRFPLPTDGQTAFKVILNIKGNAKIQHAFPFFQMAIWDWCYQCGSMTYEFKDLINW